MKKFIAALKKAVKLVEEGNKQFVHSMQLTRTSYYLDNCCIWY